MLPMDLILPKSAGTGAFSKQLQENSDTSTPANITATSTLNTPRRSGRSRLCSVSSYLNIITTNSKRTMIAPAYNITCSIARNGALNMAYIQATVKSVIIKDSALYMTLFCRTTAAAEMTAMANAVSTNICSLCLVKSQGVYLGCASAGCVQTSLIARQRSLFYQDFLIVVQLFPAVAGLGNLPGVHIHGVHRACLFAHPAPAAHGYVYLEALRTFFNLRVFMLGGHYVYTLHRAHRLAEHTGHTPCRAVRPRIQPVFPAPPL